MENYIFENNRKFKCPCCYNVDLEITYEKDRVFVMCWNCDIAYFLPYDDEQKLIHNINETNKEIRELLWPGQTINSIINELNDK